MGGEEFIIDRELDARGMNCPLPLLKLKQQINSMESGQIIQVLTTDQGSLRDFKAYTHQVGHKMLQLSEENDQYRFVIKKR